MRLATLLVALPLVFGSTPSSWAESRLVTVESQNTVAETSDRIVAKLKEIGITPAARIDHAAAARANGLTLPDTEVILFGNPKLGTPLIMANPEIAIDLPMRILVWQTSDGKVMVGYSAPAEVLGRHGLEERQEAIQTMNKVLSNIAQSAAAAE